MSANSLPNQPQFWETESGKRVRLHPFPAAIYKVKKYLAASIRKIELRWLGSHEQKGKEYLSKSI
ncbi:hypothetical protein CsSME_00028753 [Camellia sinensis var. sinensis]